MNCDLPALLAVWPKEDPGAPAAMRSVVPRSSRPGLSKSADETKRRRSRLSPAGEVQKDRAAFPTILAFTPEQRRSLAQ